VLAIFSFDRIRIFPFGGVRQTLFLSPFLFVFAGLGFQTLWRYRVTRIAGGAVAALYFLLWALNLPLFYRDRLAAYDTSDLVALWQQHGELPFNAAFCAEEIRYALRNHREISVRPLSNDQMDSAPYFLVLKIGPANDQTSSPTFAEIYRRKGLTLTLLVARPARHPEAAACHQCIYSPPSGLWIYRVDSPRPT
jgi:hypothetical protein